MLQEISMKLFFFGLLHMECLSYLLTNEILTSKYLASCNKVPNQSQIVTNITFVCRFTQVYETLLIPRRMYFYTRNVIAIFICLEVDLNDRSFRNNFKNYFQKMFCSRNKFFPSLTTFKFQAPVTRSTF